MFTNSIEEYNLEANEYSVGHTSPSNIALVKYWGKFGRQFPRNPSLSITLDKAHTSTRVKFSKKDTQGISLTFKFEGKEKTDFANKIQKFLESIVEEFPYLPLYHLDIESSNTFPHSSGIASSASSMSALAMCLCDFERELLKTKPSEEDFLNKASYIARLGSGSASRSVFAKMASWGESYELGSVNEFASPYTDFAPIFEDICDSVAIISSGEKAVSSRAGHALMENHPFAQTRFESAHHNIATLVKALKEGDFKSFAEVVEIEALELHGLMMNSRPSFILMAPNTLEAINRIRKFREDTETMVCFTLDAGPNVHILYPQSEKSTVLKFIEEEITPLTQGGLVIHDHMGNGPVKL